MGHDSQQKPLRARFRHIPTGGQFKRSNDTTVYEKLASHTYCVFAIRRFTKHGSEVFTGTRFQIPNVSEMVIPVGSDVQQNPFD